MPPVPDANAESSPATEGNSPQQTTDASAGSAESSTTQTPQTESDGKAASSTATAAEPKSSLEAMKQASTILSNANAERTGQTKAGESPTQEASGKTDAEQQGSKTEGATEGDDAAEADRKWRESLKPETAARFKKLTDDLAVVAPKVKNWDGLQAWVAEAGFKDPKQFARGLDFLRMANLEPHKAIPILEQTLESLKRRVGAAGDLPADIQERLDNGIIDEPTARELATERGRNRFQQEREEQGRQEAEANRVREAEETRVDTIANAVSAAEVAWQKSDPDYGKLAPLVQNAVLALLQQKGNTIRTAEDAQKLYKEAIAQVKQAAGTIRGPLREVKAPVGDGGGGKVTAPEPKSSLEAMQLKQRQMRATGG